MSFFSSTNPFLDILIFIFVVDLWFHDEIIDLRNTIKNFVINIKSKIYSFIFTDFIDSLFIFYYAKIKQLLSKSYALNFESKDIYDCPICLDPFYIKHAQTILHCGHRYHTSCITKWKHQEIIQNVYTKYNDKHSCPICYAPYNRYQQWNYLYCIDYKKIRINNNIQY